MDDLDRLLAESMHGAADHAPSDVGLLSVVHQRSRHYHRRRVATGLAALAAVVALGIPAVAVLATRPHPVAPSSVTPVLPSLSPVLSPVLSPSAFPSPTYTSKPTLKLVAGYTAPTFPYTLPPTTGMKAPVASMDNGNLIAFFEAIDIRHHSDTTVTVSSRKPTFTTQATQAQVQVRGHTGTLRTVDVKPAKQLTLYWPEATNRWIQLSTDDTYTPQQVVALAESLSTASIPVLPPFTLDLSPAGSTVDSITASAIRFHTPTGEFSCVLLKRRQLATTNQTVNGFKAQLTHNANGVTLDVDVSDWDATLEVTVTSGLTISDADLLRFTTGVHILNRSEPA